jgi:hypothetical protein
MTEHLYLAPEFAVVLRKLEEFTLLDGQNLGHAPS